MIAEIWHWWIGVILTLVSVLDCRRRGRRLPEGGHRQAVSGQAPTPRRLTDRWSRWSSRARPPTASPRSWAAAPSRRPARPSPARCRAVPIRLRCSPWLSPRDASSTPCTSTTACDLDSAAEADVGPPHRRSVRRRRSAHVRVDVADGPNLEARARAARYARAARRRADRPHRRRPGRDGVLNLLRGASQPAWPAMRPGHAATDPRACAGPTPSGAARALELDDRRRSSRTDDPRVPAQPGPPRAAAAADRAWPVATWCRC